MALTEIKKQLELKYYQYELTTAVYMLEPWEKYIVNSIALVGAGLFFYTGATYTPQYVSNIASYSSAFFP